MPDSTPLPDWIRDARARLGWSAAEMARRIVDEAARDGEDLGLSQQAVSNFENGGTKTTPRWTKFAQRAVRRADGNVDDSPQSPNHGAEQLDLVAIASIDQAYGLGGTFTDVGVEETVMHFPRVWIETITHSPPSLLTFTRGRGDSMVPTINDNDLVLIDRSRRTVREQDAIWAFTIGDVGMIKRLRIRGSKVTILSDNDRIPPDEAEAEEINIVGRISFIGKRV